MRILFCDDDPDILTQLQDYVAEYFAHIGGFIPEYQAYTSGELLLENEHSADIAFLDVEMPGLSGIQVGAELKKCNPACKIFIVTSYPDYLDEAMKFQVFRYLSKPIDKSRLFRNLKDAIYQHTMETREYPILTETGLVVMRADEIVCVAVFCARIFSPHKYENEEPRFFALFCVLPVASAFLCTIIVYIGMHSEVNQTTGAMMTINIVALLIINLLFLSIYNHMQKMHAEQLQTQLRMQKEENDALYYQTLQEQSDSQRILIHDIKNHMHTMKRLAEQGQTDAISEYLSKMDETVLSIPQTRLCNEPVLNILLLRFADDCKKAGVTFSCDIRDNCLAFMDPVSITALFGNLLSNALEAAVSSKEREIELSVRYSNIQAAVIIAVSNSCDSAPTPDAEGLYLTSKEDRKLHGIGLKSIQRIVQKYHGLSAAKYVAERRAFYHFIHIPYQISD